MTVNLAVKTILACAPLSAFLQATQSGPIPDLPWISQFERLSLVSALVIAVAVLWKSSRSEMAKREETYRADIAKKEDQLTKKDEQLILSAKHVTEALVGQAETSRELRKALEDSIRVKEHLAVSFEALADKIGRLPCTEEQADPNVGSNWERAPQTGRRKT